MALHWNVTKCADAEALTKKPEWGITEALIWMTMAVDLGDITEKNLDEWMVRLRVVEKTTGPILRDGNGKDLKVTREMVERRIGLKTNVINKTRAFWAKKTARMLFEDAEREVRREKAKKEEEVA